MNWVDDVIRDFGRGMGFPELHLDEQGVVTLAFEKRGTLFIEKVEEGSTISLLIYLARSLSTHHTDYLSQALRLCHFQEGHALPIYAGLKDDTTLVLLTRLTDHEFTLPRLENAVELLTQLHQQLAQ